jgi:hypothetical protein
MAAAAYAIQGASTFGSTKYIAACHETGHLIWDVRVLQRFIDDGFPARAVVYRNNDGWGGRNWSGISMSVAPDDADRAMGRLHGRDGFCAR